MDLTMIIVLALALVAAIVVYTQLQGKAPEPVDIVATSSPHKRKKKKQPEEKKQENFKWDADDGKSKKTRETDKEFNPVAAGKKMVSEAKVAAQEEKKTELSDRQRNKLQAQGFVAMESKKKPKRSASADSGDDDEGDDADGAYAGMSAAAAERLKLLEKIASGKRIGPDDNFGDRPKKKDTTVGQERRIDHALVAERLKKEKEEREQAALSKTKIGGGKVAFQGTTTKTSATNVWRSAAASPPADSGAAEPEEEDQ